jgi:hypothetical protein
MTSGMSTHRQTVSAAHAREIKHLRRENPAARRASVSEKTAEKLLIGQIILRPEGAA